MKKSVLLIIILVFLLVGCQPSREEMIADNLDKLDDENPFTRQQAVASLGATLDESVIKPIALMLTDEEQKVVDQAHNELNRLYTVDQPVVKLLLELFNETEDSWRSAAIAYFIETDEIQLNDVVLQNLELLKENFEIYKDLLVLAEQKENTLDVLWREEKSKNVSETILYYDALGYTPSIDNYKSTFESLEEEDSLKEQDIYLAIRLLIRNSYEVEYEEDEKYMVGYRNNSVEIINDFTPSKERCEEADKYYSSLPEEIHVVTQALLIKEDQQRHEQFFNDVIDAGYEENNLLIEDLDTLKEDHLEVVSNYLAKKEDLSDMVQKELGVEELMASAFIEHSPSEELLNQKKILVVYSNGEFFDKLHWQLDEEYRPSRKEEIRYVFSIPRTSGLLTFSDRYYNQEILNREIGEETDLYELLQEAISKIEE